MDKVTPYLKTYAALIGSIATALLAVYKGDTQVGQILTVVSVIATAIVTWAVPNLDPKATHQDESVQPPARNQFGDASVLYVLLVVLVVLVILAIVGVL